MWEGHKQGIVINPILNNQGLNTKNNNYIIINDMSKGNYNTMFLHMDFKIKRTPWFHHFNLDTSLLTVLKSHLTKKKKKFALRWFEV